MKKLKWWGAVGVVAAGIALIGCGSSNSSGDSASLRLINATNTHASLDMLVNSAVAVSATATDTVSAYVSPGSGSNTLQLNDSGSGTALATTVPTLSAGNHYTVLAYESGGNIKTVVLPEDIATPATGAVTLRLYDAAIEAGKLDVYVTSNACTNLSSVAASASFGTLTAPAAISLTQGVGTFNVCVTGLGSKSDLRLSMPITVASQQVATVVMTPASGGLLLNGGLLIQQSNFAATRNTNVRMRLAAAVSGGATVAASAGTTTIDAGSVAPALGSYVLVPATSALNISVNGSSVGAPAGLVAGSDVTLLVYGNVGSATAALITDDNRSPSDSTTVKLRFINGITGSTGALTLTANASQVGSAIASGTASDYASIPGSTTAMNLTLYSSAVAGVYYTGSATFSANTVYTVLVGGNVSTPQLLIR